MIRVAIITSSKRGTASFFLPYLLASSNIKVVAVFLRKGIIPKKKNFYKKKLKKLIKIGIGGALNGIRMRKWFTEDVNNLTKVQDLQTICADNNVPYFETDSINNDYTFSQLTTINADVGLSLGNGYISSKIFSIPRYGMINFHGEVLPQFQNAQSVIWQIYEGSEQTGYTIHKIDKGIDTGDILKQEVFPIVLKQTLKETVSYTCAEIQKRAAMGMVDVLSNFDVYRVNVSKQGKGRSYTTPSLLQFARISRNYKKLLKRANFGE